MQDIIVEKPYAFVPPHRGTLWPRVMRDLRVHEWWLRKVEGVVGYECHHAERIRASIDAGHGVLITPNHCRNADPVVMGWLTKEINSFVFAMASWHLFNQSAFLRFAIRRMGGFSVNREGVDRQAINTGIDVLVSAERPLVIFPEGAVSRTNDRLQCFPSTIPYWSLLFLLAPFR